MCSRLQKSAEVATRPTGGIWRRGVVCRRRAFRKLRVLAKCQTTWVCHWQINERFFALWVFWRFSYSNSWEILWVSTVSDLLGIFIGWVLRPQGSAEILTPPKPSPCHGTNWVCSTQWRKFFFFAKRWMKQWHFRGFSFLLRWKLDL